MCEEEKEIENQAHRNRRGGLGRLQGPQIWIKLTFNKMTITVKRKKEPKNINHIKFLKNY